jgi:hypothetical protein
MMLFEHGVQSILQIYGSAIMFLIQIATYIDKLG